MFEEEQKWGEICGELVLNPTPLDLGLSGKSTVFILQFFMRKKQVGIWHRGYRLPQDGAVIRTF